MVLNEPNKWAYSVHIRPRFARPFLCTTLPCWCVRAFPRAVSQWVENTTDSIHSSAEGTHLTLKPHRQHLYDCQPHSSSRNLRLQKLKLFTKVSPARLTTGLYPQPPPLLASLKSPPSQIEAMSPMIQSRGQDQTISVPKIKSHKQIKYMFALSKCV